MAFAQANPFPLAGSSLGSSVHPGSLAGRVADAVPLLTWALEQIIAKEMLVYQVLCRFALNEAYPLASRLEEAQTFAEGALALARARRERGHQAYALRLIGEIAARRPVWTGRASPTPAPTSKPGQPALVTERLEEPPAQSGSPPAAPPVPEAERRRLTVLFCDLVDSAVLTSWLSPEDWRAVVQAYQVACAKVIARFEGYLAQWLGDAP